ncbi:biotin-dependent carboxyltransferase family protein [Methylobacterium sp. BTF04]|uniref:5-oxoprolinase subunit C family protein n=1 Tax=Methylobacterium sp. BTF04 TaxID=2708300 RepID=UPI0032B19E80
MSPVRLAIRDCSGAVGLQDTGRVGYQRQGLSASGPVDSLAMAAANVLVGNPAGTLAIEFGLGGGILRAEGGPIRVGIAGAPCVLRVDGTNMPCHRSFVLPDSADLTVAPPREGMFAYLAVAGGFAVSAILGSAALHRRAGLGGLDGRALRRGDILDLAASDRAWDPDRGIAPLSLDLAEPIRMLLGPQADHFSEAGLATFLGAAFSVSHRADRMGYQLDGPTIAHGPQGYNIVSDATVDGSIQVPGSGLPIILMADRQTTGGYPKIATVVSADLRRVAQRRPGDTIRFAAVSLDRALELARERAARIAGLARRLQDIAQFDADRLAGANLAGEATDALRDLS